MGRKAAGDPSTLQTSLGFLCSRLAGCIGMEISQAVDRWLSYPIAIGDSLGHVAIALSWSPTPK